jgi:hypothetical protein
MGQAKIARGQEWQFKTGRQNDLNSKKKDEFRAIADKI